MGWTNLTKDLPTVVFINLTLKYVSYFGIGVVWKSFLFVFLSIFVGALVITSDANAEARKMNLLLVFAFASVLRLRHPWNRNETPCYKAQFFLFEFFVAQGENGLLWTTSMSSNEAPSNFKLSNRGCNRGNSGILRNRKKYIPCITGLSRQFILTD